MLSQLVHSYVYGDVVPWERLEGGVAREGGKAVHEVPAQLAVPWAHVCDALGLPPVLCASATDLWNWTFVTGGGGRCADGGDAVGATVTFENLTLLSSVTGTMTETAFHTGGLGWSSC